MVCCGHRHGLCGFPAAWVKAAQGTEALRFAGGGGARGFAAGTQGEGRGADAREAQDAAQATRAPRMKHPLSRCSSSFFKGRRGAAEAAAEDAQKALDQHALSAVDTAVKVNLAIAFSKAAVYQLSGSSAIFGEALHSVADVANQLLLRLGIQQSKRKPDERYHYGFMRDRFVMSLISGVVIFTGGACASASHGVMALLSGTHAVEHHVPGLAVLGISLLLESYSLAVAYRAIASGAAAEGLSVGAYIQSGRDPTSFVILAEDSAAVVGCIVAGAALAASSALGSPIPDALGSLVVGSLLVAVSYAVVQINRQLLLGRSMDGSRQRRVLALLESDPVVSHVYEHKSEEIGPGKFRFMAEVQFDGAAVVERYLERMSGEKDALRLAGAELATARAAGGPLAVMERFRHLAQDDRDAAAFRGALRGWGEGLVEAMGDEVDRLERKIRDLEPGILHVELEPH